MSDFECIIFVKIAGSDAKVQRANAESGRVVCYKFFQDSGEVTDLFGAWCWGGFRCEDGASVVWLRLCSLLNSTSVARLRGQTFESTTGNFERERPDHIVVILMQ